MFIEFKCPHCQTKLQDPSDFAGRKAKCPRCKKQVIVPEVSGSSKENSKEKLRDRNDNSLG